MKKYKVVTDNLDWYHLPKGRIVAITSPGEFEGGINHFQQTIEECMLLHPDWFEEVQEKEFTRADMVDPYHPHRGHEFCGGLGDNDLMVDIEITNTRER